MHEKINEHIEVSVAFLHNKVIPRKFVWNSRLYTITQLTMVHHKYIGRDKVYYFSVSDGVQFFRLAFSTNNLTWTLEELYVE